MSIEVELAQVTRERTQVTRGTHKAEDWPLAQAFWQEIYEYITRMVEMPDEAQPAQRSPAPIELPDPAPTDPPHEAKRKADAKYPKTGDHIHPGWWRVMCLWFDGYSKQEGVHYTNQDFAVLAEVDVRQIYRAKKQYRPKHDI